MSAAVNTVEAQASGANVARSRRLVSIDFVRGLTVAFMILVNDNGDRVHAYWPLKHAEWNGFTPTDLVFPTFLFLVGVAIVLAIDSRLAKGETHVSLLIHTLRRSVLLFLVGIAIHLYPHFDVHTMRFYGVLPRIAICYLFCSVFYIANPNWRSCVVIAVSSLVGYWILMRFVPVPGFGIPTRRIPLLDPDANIVAWLDRKLFFASHLYERTRDPEGLLSTIPALGTTMMGEICGLWLRRGRQLTAQIRGVAVAGVASVLLGGLWNLFFPINKKLWTSSFVLFAGGLSLLLLAFAMWLVDMPPARKGGRHSRWKRLVVSSMLVFGTNAIAAYAFSELLALTIVHIDVAPGLSIKQYLNNLIVSAIPDAAFASLAYSLSFVAVCWFAMYLLFRKQIIVKL